MNFSHARILCLGDVMHDCFVYCQIERISPPPSEEDDAGAEPGVARQLNDAISRLDARLSQISNRASARPDG